MPRAQGKPLCCYSITVAENHLPLPEPETFDNALDEFFKQWVYQGELGESRKKRHYQVRAIVEDACYKQTLLQVMTMRGMDRRDITILPESNRSIQQGGLAFYVMDSTKPRFLEPRSDPSYKPKRPRYFCPLQCEYHRDNPRPWMKSQLEILNSAPPHRAITWICTLEGLGGVAKSNWNTYLQSMGWCHYVGDGTPINLKQNVIKAGERRAYSFDLPKTFDRASPLSDYINAIEVIKNGHVCATMHGKPEMLIMDVRPHIFVYANCIPPFSSMTQGRFNVYTIDPIKPHEEQTLDTYVP